MEHGKDAPANKRLWPDEKKKVKQVQETFTTTTYTSRGARKVAVGKQVKANGKTLSVTKILSVDFNGMKEIKISGIGVPYPPAE